MVLDATWWTVKFYPIKKEMEQDIRRTFKFVKKLWCIEKDAIIFDYPGFGSNIKCAHAIKNAKKIPISTGTKWFNATRRKSPLLLHNLLVRAMKNCRYRTSKYLHHLRKFVFAWQALPDRWVAWTGSATILLYF